MAAFFILMSATAKVHRELLHILLKPIEVYLLKVHFYLTLIFI